MTVLVVYYLIFNNVMQTKAAFTQCNSPDIVCFLLLMSMQQVLLRVHGRSSSQWGQVQNKLQQVHDEQAQVQAVHRQTVDGRVQLRKLCGERQKMHHE